MTKVILEPCSVVRICRILVGWHAVAILATFLTTPTQLLAQSGSGGFFRSFLDENSVSPVCSERTNWDASSGPVTAWTEAVYIFQSPFGIVLLGVFALALLTAKNQWLLGAGIGALALGTLIQFVGGPSELSQSFMTENCSGPTSTAVAICAAICLTCAGIFVIKRRLRGEHNA